MDHYTKFPPRAIQASGPVSQHFLAMNITDFLAACRFVQELPYGYNSDRDDLMILFKEKMGTCTTKHAVIATLAQELRLPIHKHVGIYAMTEELVACTDAILAKYHLPYVPMLHCFLVSGDTRVDLTEGNNNGKKRGIDTFLFSQQVAPNISAKDEYLLYRKVLADSIINHQELNGVAMKQILHAREEGLALLKANIRWGGDESIYTTLSGNIRPT